MNQVQIFLPPPANWQDFQNLLIDIAKVKFDENSVQEYGRQGQAQNGIDVFAKDSMGNNIGIQCKETKNRTITIAIVNSEIEKAKSFKPNIKLFIIATTARIDNKLQDHVNELNDLQKQPFQVQIWFWDTLNQDINRFHSVMATSYGFFQKTFGASEQQNHLAALRLAFDRPAYTDDFLAERNYKDFESALVGTKAFFKIGILHDNWSKSIIAQTIPSSMIGNESYKKFATNIEGKVENIYKNLQRDFNAEHENQKQLIERAGQYNILRRNLLNYLNQRLIKHGLSEIKMNY